MSGEGKLTLFDFVSKDRFELNNYLTYLFEQFYNNDPDQSENLTKIVNGKGKK